MVNLISKKLTLREFFYLEQITDELKIEVAEGIFKTLKEDPFKTFLYKHLQLHFNTQKSITIYLDGYDQETLDAYLLLKRLEGIEY